jgi:hypothetical protein
VDPGYPQGVTITAAHLTQLFDSDLPDPQLVVEAGEARVVAGPSGDQQGFVVASRAELLEENGGSAPSGEALDQLAARLETAVTGMGG